MAAGSMDLLLSNGQKISVYVAAGQVVNSPLRMNIAGEAAATSPFTFSVLGNACINDIVNVTNASGEMEIIADGVRTGKKIPQDARFAIGQVGRDTSVFRYCFRPGVSYGLWQTIVQA